MRPLLSICVPTFHRAQVVYHTVLNHLGHESNQIEVVVSDNGSQDNTVELLSSIKDPRFKFYTNSVNRGFQYNLYNVIKKASGHFVCCMSDQDVLNAEELNQILEWIRQFVQDNNGIGAIIPGNSNGIITKRDELVNALYGRTSYMSGIILNRDLLTEEDFEICEENYYAHIALLLLCGSRGRIVFSPYPLISQYYTKDEEGQKRANLEKANKGNCKITPYSPKSRYNQLKSEKHMILNLDISDEIKFELLTKQYEVKLLQGTLQFESIKRSEECCNELNVDPIEQSIGMENRMSIAYKQTIEEYLDKNKEYIEKATENIERWTKYIHVIRNCRQAYDQLTLRNNYKVVMIGKQNYITQYVDALTKYNYRVDYLCITDLEVKSDVTISEDELVNFDKIVLLVDQQDEACIQRLKNIKLNEAHFFSVQELRILI